MHTTKWRGLASSDRYPKTPGPTKPAEVVDIVMHHNGDYSGNVKISLPSSIADSEVEHNPHGRDVSYTTVTIPFGAIRHLVVEAMRQQWISRLENMSESDLLDLARELVGGS